jgi:hypothetical protein
MMVGNPITSLKKRIEGTLSLAAQRLGLEPAPQKETPPQGRRRVGDALSEGASGIYFISFLMHAKRQEACQ